MTTITIDPRVKRGLDKLREYPREPYNEVVARLVKQSSEGHDEIDVEETISILSDPKTMRDLAQGIEDLRKGRVIPLSEA